jgi:hypothetical protein
MKGRVHGLITILLALIVFLLANYSFYQISFYFGIAYSVYLPIMFLILEFRTPKSHRLQGGKPTSSHLQ